MTKTILEKEIEVQKAFKDISDDSWDKVILRCVFNSQYAHALNRFYFSKTMIENNPKFVKEREPNIYSFTSDEVVNDVKNVFSNVGTYIISRDTVRGSGGKGEGKGFIPNTVFGILLENESNDFSRNNRLFINFDSKGHRCKMKSLQVLQFLKKYSNDNTFPVIYPAGMEVERSEVGLPEPVVVNNPPIDNPKEEEETLKPGGNTKPKSLKVEDEQKELEVKDQVAQIEEIKK